MREFLDGYTGLTWLSGERLRDIGGVAEYGYDKLLMEDFINEINEWRSNNIAKYLTYDNLGNYLYNYQLDENMYFAFDGGELAGVSVIEGDQELTYANLFREHITNVDIGFMDRMNRFMSYDLALKALKRSNEHNNSFMNYIVVNPNRQGRGIGTRMLRSITDNMEFFTGNEQDNVLSANVFYSNKASRKMFEKNDFYLLNTDSMIGGGQVFNANGFVNYFHVNEMEA